jgi:hypothetical protein
MMRLLLILVAVSGVASCDCIGDGGGTAVLFVNNQASVAIRVVVDLGLDAPTVVDAAAGERVELTEIFDTGGNPAPAVHLTSVRLFVAGTDDEVANFDALTNDAWTPGALNRYEGFCSSRYGTRDWDLVIDDEDLVRE